MRRAPPTGLPMRAVVGRPAAKGFDYDCSVRPSRRVRTLMRGRLPFGDWIMARTQLLTLKRLAEVTMVGTRRGALTRFPGPDSRLEGRPTA